MTQWSPPNMLEHYQNMKRPKQRYAVHSCLGFGKSLKQYRAALNQDTSASDALYFSSDFPKPRHE